MDFIEIVPFSLQLLGKSSFFAITLLITICGAASAECASESDWALKPLGKQATIIYSNMPTFSIPCEGQNTLTEQFQTKGGEINERWPLSQ